MLTKTGLRGTAAGVFIATTVFAGFLYTSDDQELAAQSSSNVSEEDAIETLETAQYIILTENQYSEMESHQNSLQSKIEELEQFQDAYEEQDRSEEEDRDEETSGDDTIVYQTSLVVQSGMTFGDIASLLERSQVINNRDTFNDYVSDNNVEMDLRQGEFIFDSTMSIEDIVSELTS
ncbi:endolytic transglycosylase MltG [Alteribacter populi]|uniref:endolytic transglycosylase MltG n=1 Tax=Alteribacter populi TaxID=2011011 RepID=UPI000BBAACF5|nr:endolytic transglycosylase MltG [Alteribacter populi]